MAFCVFKQICRQNLFRGKCFNTFNCNVKRTFLSESYRCDESWEKRLRSPLLKDVEVSQFAMRIQESLDRSNFVTAVDMDILSNVLHKIDPLQLDFVQNLFYRFRYSADAINILESTSHAIVRACLHFEEIDRLLHMLQDKDNYGIFLDDFSANILLDYFLKKEDYTNAAQIAFDQMLQENLTHPLVKYLSWYACHQLWKNPSAPSKESEENQPQEDEEETWVLVKYIRPHWYDDHWDIPKDTMRIGKVFYTVTYANESILGRSYHLIGLALWEKYDEVLRYLETLVETKTTECIGKESLITVEKLLDDLETKEPPTEEKDPGLLRMEDVIPYITESQKQQYIEQYKILKENLLSQNQTTDIDLQAELLSEVKKVISVTESKDIEQQNLLFNKWSELRQQRLNEYLRKVYVEKRKKEIADRMLELREKEERLRFFEQIDKINLGISRRIPVQPIEDEAEEEQFVAPPTASGKRN